MRAAVITISTSKAAGEGEDESGPLLEEVARQLGAEEVARELLPDDRVAIEAALRRWSTHEGAGLILTTGGTGLAPSDVTPDATLAVIDREILGIGEAMRLISRGHTPHWMLSRATAGICGESLIVNFPGSPKSIPQVAQELLPALRHALGLIAQAPTPHS